MGKHANIKYIHLISNATQGSMHTLADYEFMTMTLVHDSFDGLLELVKTHCPDGYKCLYPLALHHEVLWRIDGETDQLYRPIDTQEYDLINWDRPPFISLCVEIMQTEESRDAAKGPVLLLASLGNTDPLHSPRHPGAALRLR